MGEGDFFGTDISLPEPFKSWNIRPEIEWREAAFLRSRQVGWEDTKPLQVAFDSRVKGLSPKEREPIRRRLAEEISQHQEAAVDTLRKTYREAVELRLDGESKRIDLRFLPELNARVVFLRAELERKAEQLQPEKNADLMDWLKATYALVRERCDSLLGTGEKEDRRTARRILHQWERLRDSGIGHGQVPEVTLQWAEYLLANELSLRMSVVRAQLAGLAYLLASREPDVIYAVEVRDKRDLYEALLSLAALDTDPLTDEAVEKAVGQRRRGNPSYKPLDDKIVREMCARADQLLKEDNETYKPLKSGALVSNALRDKIVEEYEDRGVSETTAYKYLRSHYEAEK